MNTPRNRTSSYGIVLSGASSLALGAAAACSSGTTMTVATADASVDGHTATRSTGGAGGARAGSEGGAATNTKVTMARMTADQGSTAANIDPNLVNAWGLAINRDAPNGPVLWIADNGTGMATVYDSTGKALPVSVTIPSPVDSGGPSAPTGQVYNPSTAFAGDLFIFATEDGTVAGWKSGARATVRVSSGGDAKYKGIAIIDDAGVVTLAVADFHNAKVDVFDANYEPVATPNAFVDAAMPDGYAPFNIANLGGKVYVTYAKQDDDKEDDVKGAGFGFVDVFDSRGGNVRRLVARGDLNAPWGLTIAPSGFGALSGALLVGNFGDGRIHAYDPVTAKMMGELVDSTGKPVVIDGLWAIETGPKTTSVDLSETLFFTAGPAGEKHGLFGSLKAAR